ncbi:MAG: hypothetical protein JXQ82_10235 [Methanomicrobiaceae archaeon]|nr:hypothetical protein [Methanomicrobiaceae archaeon]
MMNEKTEIAIAAIILVAAIILIPIGIAGFMHNAQPYRIIEGEPVKDAAIAAGLSVCSVSDTLSDLPGAAGGKTYVISDNCADPTETIRVETQAFDSEESRDAAIKIYNSKTIGKLKGSGNLIVAGQYLVYINGNSELFGRISNELKKI